MRYRILQDGAEVADLSEHDPVRLGDFSAPRGWLAKGGALPDGYVIEAYDPPAPEPEPLDPATLSLTPAQFYAAVDDMAALKPNDPAPDLWLEQQVSASTALTPAQKRDALILVRKAQQFDRAHPFMDVLAQAILGITPAELDAAFVATFEASAP